MCYAIPGKIEVIENKRVVVDYFGEKRKAYNEIENLKVGDYIYAQGGYVIKSIPAHEADAILAVWKETFFELQEVDLRLSRIHYEATSTHAALSRILDRILEGGRVSREDLLYLFNLDNESELALLYKVGNFLRQKHLSNSCCVHGIIEFSNYCKQACRYCGISTCNTALQRYRMTKAEIVACAEEACTTYGFQALVLQSGEDNFYSIDDLAEIIREIKKRSAVLLFISMGEIGVEGLRRLYKAGARGLLMRFETSNADLYHELHPGLSLETRLAHIRAAYEMGYLIITGSLIGVPGQTGGDIVSDIMLAKELHAEMYSFGPFIPHPHTSLACSPPATSSDIMKVLALTRIVDPENAKILVTTAFETIDEHARHKGLLAGANSVMLNVTPQQCQQHYTLYPHRAYLDIDLATQITTTLTLLRSLGRAPTDLGAS